MFFSLTIRPLSVLFRLQVEGCNLVDNLLTILNSGDLRSLDEGILGASAHSDYGMITLLVTNGISGLQVLRSYLLEKIVCIMR